MDVCFNFVIFQQQTFAKECDRSTVNLYCKNFQIYKNKAIRSTSGGRNVFSYCTKLICVILIFSKDI